MIPVDYKTARYLQLIVHDTVTDEVDSHALRPASADIKLRNGSERLTQRIFARH